MTVGFRAAGSWENGTTGLTADEVVAVPAAQVTGDMMLLIGCWKDFAITAQVSGWTELFELADGTTGTGNGTGSMKVGVWYKVATSDTEADPTLDFSTTTGLVGEATIVVFSKGASAIWATPTFVVGAWPNGGSSAQTISAGSTIDVPTGGAVVSVLAIRDDSATFTRGNTALDDAGGLVTWNGNYAEQPATHASTTTGNDMSCDAGYRLVTTGASGVTLRQTATLSANETGQGAWIILAEAVNPSGTGAITVPAATVSGTGSEILTSTGAISVPAPTVAGTGAERLTATGSVTVPAATVAGSGAERFTSTGAVSVPPPTVAGAGTHTGGAPPNPTGTGAISIPAATTAGTGSLGLTATGSVTVPAATVNGTGAERFTATGSVTAPIAIVAGTGTHRQNVTGTGSVTAPAGAMSGTGSGGAMGGSGGRRGPVPPRPDDDFVLDNLTFEDF